VPAERLNAQDHRQTAPAVPPERLNASLFLRVDHPTFGPAFEQLSTRLLAGSAGCAGAYSEAVRDAVGPLNVAGLCHSGKRNWYPVELRDLVENAAKLGMSARAMEQWIAAAGWAALV